MTRSLPKSGILRFASIFLVCEVIAWCVLGAWDARHPQYRATVAFELKSLPMNNTAPDWMSYVRKAASDSGATEWWVVSPMFYGDVKNLKDMYQQIESRVRNAFTHNRNWGLIYQLVVVSADPSQASDQANKAADLAVQSTESIYSEYEETERRRYLEKIESEAKKIRASGDTKMAKEAEANLRACKMTPNCFPSTPVRIWERAAPDNQRISTFKSPGTQAFLLSSMAIVGIIVRRLNSRTSSINLKPVV